MIIHSFGEYSLALLLYKLIVAKSQSNPKLPFFIKSSPPAHVNYPSLPKNNQNANKKNK